MRLPSTISRRSLREAIRREIATGITQKQLAARFGLNETQMSRAITCVDYPSAAWTRIASTLGYGPGKETHMYVRIPAEQMREAA